MSPALLHEVGVVQDLAELVLGEVFEALDDSCRLRCVKSPRFQTAPHPVWTIPREKGEPTIWSIRVGRVWRGRAAVKDIMRSVSGFRIHQLATI